MSATLDVLTNEIVSQVEAQISVRDRLFDLQLGE
jgi:hypothetical protein